MATSLVLFKAVLDCNTRLVRELCNLERLDESLGYRDPHSRWTPLLLAAAQAGERVSCLPRCWHKPAAIQAATESFVRTSTPLQHWSGYRQPRPPLADRRQVLSILLDALEHGSRRADHHFAACTS
jgi:hypothetical protein